MFLPECLRSFSGDLLLLRGSNEVIFFGRCSDLLLPRGDLLLPPDLGGNFSDDLLLPTDLGGNPSDDLLLARDLGGSFSEDLLLEKDLDGNLSVDLVRLRGCSGAAIFLTNFSEEVLPGGLCSLSDDLLFLSGCPLDGCFSNKFRLFSKDLLLFGLACSISSRFFGICSDELLVGNFFSGGSPSNEGSLVGFFGGVFRLAVEERRSPSGESDGGVACLGKAVR